MILNYFNIIIQNIVRNKTYALINLLGLSIGLAVCMVIMQFVRFERSYDQFHPKANSIFRVILESTPSTGIPHVDAANYAPVGEAMKNDFPEVRNFVRISPEYDKVVFSFGDKVNEADKIYYADSSMFTVFGYKLIAGDAVTALADINSIVLNRTTAERCFGPMNTWKESPLNKIIMMNNRLPLKVTAIMEDMPANTHFRANGLISFSTFVKRNDPSQNWGWNDFYTYVELVSGTDYKMVESKLRGLITKNQSKDARDRMFLQPLPDIHLHSNVGFELNPNGSAQTVYFLSIIALIVLIIAWVNYINLATARAGNRAKEIGVRKVNGASRREVMIQFLLESFCMNFIALLVATSLVTAFIPVVSNMLGKPLNFSLLSDKEFMVYSAGIYVIGSIVSGLYPAFVLSSFKPAEIFKPSSIFATKGNSTLRQGLVVFQFMMSAGLIMGTLIIRNQLDYIRKKDLGYSSDNTVVLNASSTQPNDSMNLLRFQTFREALLKFPEFSNVSISSVLPGKSHNDLDTHGGLRMAGDPENVNYSLTSFRVDENFLPVFDLKLIAGNNFSNQYIKSDEKLILNRKGAELLGFNDVESIIGKKIQYWGDLREVVGVIENYHHKSLKNNFEPMVLRHVVTGMLYVTVQLTHGQSVDEGKISRLKQLWESVYPNDPFVYFFQEQYINEQYQEDQRFGAIFNVFSGFSMLIACLGLFGLVSYSVTVRMKEIGVRKVLGASVVNIIVLFSKDYAKLLLISFLIGIPLAYYILSLWLDNFAYKGEVGWILFLIPVLAVGLLSWVAVSLEILKAALTNPVNSLRHE
jgi:putative ABC transport system permease protein